MQLWNAPTNVPSICFLYLMNIFKRESEDLKKREAKEMMQKENK